MKHFPELERIERIAASGEEFVQLETLCTVSEKGMTFPLYAIKVGPQGDEAELRKLPTFGLFAGVHGLERVGTHVALAFLESLTARLFWDKDTRRALSRSRIVCIPMVNPAGIYFGSRSNPNGVDLMRNAPIDAEVPVPFLIGGHRISRRLPWFRGWGSLEPEADSLISFVEREMFESEATMSLDVHSGFGMRDRLWFPYSKTGRVFSRVDQVTMVVEMLDRTYPHHIYQIEQQSSSYSTHGDLWDYIYERHEASQDRRSRLFIPWTLELGSWTWVRKNPMLVLRAAGPFNPGKAHRYSRTMRRHLILIEFFWRIVRNHRAWLKPVAHPAPSKVRDKEKAKSETAARGAAKRSKKTQEKA